MRWLHISDTHFGYDSASVEKMRDKLLQKAKDIDPVDCLFITGDLRYGKKENTAYPTETLAFIRQLQDALGVEPADTFVVPGNHDVNRGKMFQAGLEQAAKEYTTSDGMISDETLSYIRRQREPFLSLYKSICGRDEPNWHYCVQKNGFNIICLNTALFCCKDGEDGNLIVGSRLLNQLRKSVDNSLPGIVLAHHDFDSLRQEEQRELEHTLKEMGAVLYLCGHKHVALAHLQNNYRTDWDLRVFLCGTSMDRDPNLEQTDMDIFVGEADKTGKQGFVQAYKWNYSCHDWIQDINFSYPQDKAIDGRRYFPSNTRVQQIKPPSKGIIEKYRQFIRIQCGEIELNGLPTNQEDVGRKYALKSIFVPLTFKPFEGRDKENAYETIEVRQEIESNIDWSSVPREKVPDRITLGELIPLEGCFRYFILSDPGGGKTTLLKRIASVYSLQEDCNAADEGIPQRELFPVWIRCRDIPIGSRPSVWNTIENVARLGEWMPGDSAVEDFNRLVSYHIEKGTALLLIDGLDEIGSDADRQHFIEQIRIFVASQPSVSMIVTTRITGFPAMMKEKLLGFGQFEICPLRKTDIKDLCVKWYRIVYGETTEVEKRAKALADKIAGDVRIFRLARNPLLLTTLLLVERRVGRLPTKRTALYDEAIQVLLETWNQAGHEHEKVDLEETRYQLSYIAFHMTVNHMKIIVKTELHRLIREFRQNFSELVSKEEPVSDFIKKIEKRSALLIQKGYKESEAGGLEAVYEFQHLTFQEYLTAYAAVNRCYPGVKDEDSRGAALKPYLLDTTLHETISLAAILDRFCAKELAAEVIEKLTSAAEFGGTREHLRTLLLQFAADEVQLKDDMIDEIFTVCIENNKVYVGSDVKIMQQILEGRYGNKLIDCYSKLDQKYNNGYMYHKCIPLILSGEIANPYQYYIEHRLSDSFQQQMEALSTLTFGLLINKFSILQQIDAAQLKAELFGFVKSDNRHIRREAFNALSSMLPLSTVEDISNYIEACIKYINDFQRSSFSWNWLLWSEQLKDLKIEIQTCIDGEALQRICASIRAKICITFNEYKNLLVLALLSMIAQVGGEDLTNIFSLIREKRCGLIARNRMVINDLLGCDYNLSKFLQHMILLDPSHYTELQKGAVQEHILKTDLESARTMNQETLVSEFTDIFSYNDCSLFDGSSFYLSPPENSLDEVIEYITKRLEAMDRPAAVENLAST